MSNYNIGQIRYSKGVEYLLNKINKKYSSEECEYEVDTYDLKLVFPFQGLQTYYLKCSLNYENIDTSKDTELVVKLKTESEDKTKIREQIITTYTVKNTKTQNIEFAFTPRTDFVKIVFELRRTKENLEKEILFLGTQAVELFLVNNILQQELGLDSVMKLGIQGPSDLIVCINGEPIRLGASGMFELYYDDFNIFSVGFIINANKSKNFIMDYCY